MKLPNKQSGAGSTPVDDDTGLPWPRSWRGVYIFVVVVFVGWVALLAAFMAAFT